MMIQKQIFCLPLQRRVIRKPDFHHMVQSTFPGFPRSPFFSRKIRFPALPNLFYNLFYHELQYGKEIFLSFSGRKTDFSPSDSFPSGIASPRTPSYQNLIAFMTYPSMESEPAPEHISLSGRIRWLSERFSSFLFRISDRPRLPLFFPVCRSFPPPAVVLG